MKSDVGKIELTPDGGKNNGLIDIAARFTQQNL
jgi:hypothetical protein